MDVILGLFLSFLLSLLIVEVLIRAQTGVYATKLLRLINRARLVLLRKEITDNNKEKLTRFYAGKILRHSLIVGAHLAGVGFLVFFIVYSIDQYLGFSFSAIDELIKYSNLSLMTVIAGLYLFLRVRYGRSKI